MRITLPSQRKYVHTVATGLLSSFVHHPNKANVRIFVLVEIEAIY